MFLLWSHRAFGSGVFHGELAEFLLVLRVQVRVVGGDGDIDLAAWLQIRGGEFFRFVVAFGTPGDVVGVAEGVDVEDVEVRRGEEEVLHEGCDHVPGVEEEDGGDEVEDPSGGHGDDEGEEEAVGEEEGEGEAGLERDLGLHGFHRDEDRGEEEVGHEDRPEVDLGHVEFVAALGSVAQREDEAGDQCCQVEPFEDDGHDQAGGPEEVFVGKGCREDAEDEEEVALC